MFRSFMQALALTIVCAAVAWGSAARSEEAKYRQLSAKEIQARVIGMAITDDAHWSDHFHPGGVLQSYDLGRLKRGSWSLDGNELCLTRTSKTRTTDCFEVWVARDAVQYRRDGIVVADGYLRAIPQQSIPSSREPE